MSITISTTKPRQRGIVIELEIVIEIVTRRPRIVRCLPLVDRQPP
jgi:hypothetical protein